MFGLRFSTKGMLTLFKRRHQSVSCVGMRHKTMDKHRYLMSWRQNYFMLRTCWTDFGACCLSNNISTCRDGGRPCGSERKRLLASWRSRSLCSGLKAEGDTLPSYRILSSTSSFTSVITPGRVNTKILLQSFTYIVLWKTNKCTSPTFKTVRGKRGELIGVNLQLL